MRLSENSLAIFFSTSFTLKADHQAFRSAEGQKSAGQFSDGVD